MTDLPSQGDSWVMVSEFTASAAAQLARAASSASVETPSGPRLKARDLVKQEESVHTITRVYAEHFRFVWRCLRNLGVDDAALDDAVQEVFLVVDRKLGEFVGELRPWLYAIVRRIALRHRAKQSKEARRFLHEGEHAELDAHPHGSPDLQDELERRERLELAERALDALDDSKREVFVFCVLEGLSAPEVAAIVDVPLNTVYSRLRAARREFTEAIERAQADSNLRTHASISARTNGTENVRRKS